MTERIRRREARRKEKDVANERTTLPLAALTEDPLNDEAFSRGDDAALARSMEEDGFFGEVVAYPIGDGKYALESGHRRARAAAMAGMTTIDVILTDPPKDALERRKRIVRWNLHSRPSTPMAMAKLAEFQYRTYEMENEARKAAGLKPKPALERVAADLECSVSNASKYRNLLKLIPDLSRLVESGACSWAPMSKAAALSERRQKALATRIAGMAKLGEDVTGAWLEREIAEFSMAKFYDDDEDRYVYVPKAYDDDGTDDVSSALAANRKASKRMRRKDGAKGVAKSLAYLKDAVSEASFMPRGAEKYVLDELEELVEVATRYLKSKGRDPLGASARPHGEVSYGDLANETQGQRPYGEVSDEDPATAKRVVRPHGEVSDGDLASATRDSRPHGEVSEADQKKAAGRARPHGEVSDGSRAKEGASEWEA